VTRPVMALERFGTRGKVESMLPKVEKLLFYGSFCPEASGPPLALLQGSPKIPNLKEVQMSKSYSSLSVALLLAAFLPASASAAPQDFVVMGTPLVNLRTGPSTDAMVIGRAEKGDVFKVVGQTDEWYKILMFSGEDRYVTKSDFVYPLRKDQLVEGHGMGLPTSTARCRSIFWDTEDGLDRAARRPTR